MGGNRKVLKAALSATLPVLAGSHSSASRGMLMNKQGYGWLDVMMSAMAFAVGIIPAITLTSTFNPLCALMVNARHLFMGLIARESTKTWAG